MQPNDTLQIHINSDAIRAKNELSEQLMARAKSGTYLFCAARVIMKAILEDSARQGLRTAHLGIRPTHALPWVRQIGLFVLIEQRYEDHISGQTLAT